MVIDGELDLCFVPLEPQNPRLNYEIIHVEEILLAVPPQHLLHAHATVSTGATPYIDLSLFAQEPFIALKPVQKFNSMNERLCSAAGFTPHVVYETLNWDTVKRLAANGIGVGFVPDILRAASMYNRRPKYYRLMGMDTSRAYAVAYKEGDGIILAGASSLWNCFEHALNALLSDRNIDKRDIFIPESYKLCVHTALRRTPNPLSI